MTAGEQQATEYGEGDLPPVQAIRCQFGAPPFAGTMRAVAATKRPSQQPAIGIAPLMSSDSGLVTWSIPLVRTKGDTAGNHRLDLDVSHNRRTTGFREIIGATM